MFTGIVLAVGEVRRLTRRGSSAELEVEALGIAREVSVGDSVAVAGACLTVIAKTERTFSVQLSEETLGGTTLGAVRSGDKVDLEPAMKLSDRLGGHLVSGHIDGTGRITAREDRGDTVQLRCQALPEVAPYLVPKGSVAMDGVSLTVVDVDGDEFTVILIAHTAKETTLARLKRGDRVNLEADLIGKYVRRFVEAGRTGGTKAPTGGGLTEGRLKDLGF